MVITGCLARICSPIIANCWKEIFNFESGIINNFLKNTELFHRDKIDLGRIAAVAGVITGNGGGRSALANLNVRLVVKLYLPIERFGIYVRKLLVENTNNGGTPTTAEWGKRGKQWSKQKR